MNKSTCKIISSLLISFLFTSCASIAGGGREQNISVITVEKNTKINGATCELKNDEGVWYVTTPGSTAVHRSSQDLHISCDKNEYDTNMTTVKSGIKAVTAGNAMLGPIVGTVGVLVDNASGAAYDYPSLTTIEMHKKTDNNAVSANKENKTLDSKNDDGSTTVENKENKDSDRNKTEEKKRKTNKNL